MSVSEPVVTPSTPPTLVDNGLAVLDAEVTLATLRSVIAGRQLRALKAVIQAPHIEPKMHNTRIF